MARPDAADGVLAEDELVGVCAGDVLADVSVEPPVEGEIDAPEGDVAADGSADAVDDAAVDELAGVLAEDVAGELPVAGAVDAPEAAAAADGSTDEAVADEGADEMAGVLEDEVTGVVAALEDEAAADEAADEPEELAGVLEDEVSGEPPVAVAAGAPEDEVVDDEAADEPDELAGVLEDEVPDDSAVDGDDEAVEPAGVLDDEESGELAGVPEEQVTELPSAERVHVIWDPVLADWLAPEVLDGLLPPAVAAGHSVAELGRARLVVILADGVQLVARFSLDAAPDCPPVAKAALARVPVCPDGAAVAAVGCPVPGADRGVARILAADAGLTPTTVATARPTHVTETSDTRYNLADKLIPAAAHERRRRAQSRGVVASTHGQTRSSPKALAIQTKQNGSATANHGAASNFIDKRPTSNRSESRIRREQSRPPL